MYKDKQYECNNGQSRKISNPSFERDTQTGRRLLGLLCVRAGSSTGTVLLSGGGGAVNITTRLAASSLVTKTHAREKLPRPSCRNAKTRRPASAKSLRYFRLGDLYRTSSGPCQRSHAHQRLIRGQNGEPSQGCKFPIIQ